jgi:hypothetical protein
MLLHNVGVVVYPSPKFMLIQSLGVVLQPPRTRLDAVTLLQGRRRRRGLKGSVPDERAMVPRTRYRDSQQRVAHNFRNLYLTGVFGTLAGHVVLVVVSTLHADDARA